MSEQPVQPWTPAPQTWTWSDSWWLGQRALGWMLGVTLPITVVVGLGLSAFGTVDMLGWDLVQQPWWTTVLSTLLWAAMFDLIAALPTVAGMLVAWPFTMGLGLLLRPVRSRVLQIAATSMLAGTLAASPLALVPDAYLLFVPVSLAAGAAGALARRGEFRRADRLAAAAEAAAGPESHGHDADAVAPAGSPDEPPSPTRGA